MDLTGIEDFVSLTELRCNDNQLTTLDLSQNTFLEILHCNNNQLTSLNISQNSALTDLVCSNNQLSTINVIQNTALVYLICSNNIVTSLDLSNNTSLINLTCNNNQITTLDISQNTNIVYLNCSNNQLTSLNVKNGNNTNFSFFDSTNNPNLTCIEVDNFLWSTDFWGNVDTTSTFVNDEAACLALYVTNELLNEQISIYPNPAKDIINIQNESNYPITKIALYDMFGKLVYQSNTVEQIHIKNLSKGLYLIKIISNQKTVSKKIVVSSL